MRTVPLVGVVVAAFALGASCGAWWMASRVGKPGAVAAEVMVTKPRPRPPVITGQGDSNMRGKDGVDKESPPSARQVFYERRRDLTAKVKPVVDDALQLDDEALRGKALEQIRSMMGDGDPAKVVEGFLAFVALYELQFDKASYRDVILPQLRADDELLRATAWSALMMSGLQPGDDVLMRNVARTTGMGDMTSHFLFLMEKGDLTGESGVIVRDLLDPTDAGKTKEVMRGIWGARYSAELESKLVEISKDPAMEYDAVYFALSTQSNKGRSTVERLIPVLGNSNTNTAGRAAWGLVNGVSLEMKPAVAEAAIKILGSRSTGYLNEQGWRMLEANATPQNLASLKSLVAKPNLAEEHRSKLNSMVSGMEARSTE